MRVSILHVVVNDDILRLTELSVNVRRGPFGELEPRHKPLPVPLDLPRKVSLSVQRDGQEGLLVIHSIREHRWEGAMRSHADLTAMLRIFSIAFLVYGLTFLFIPEMVGPLYKEPVPPPANWLRWPGGYLTAFGIASWTMARDPRGQGLLMMAMCTGGTLACLSLLYSAASGEYKGALPLWTFAVLLTGVLSAIGWWLYFKYQELLRPAT
ncbi:MAG TPA: hypothetical protein VGU20_21550 [Stellaceae bacterium]|nr:hypothetical protein [Stellaceae bacterium]